MTDVRAWITEALTREMTTDGVPHTGAHLTDVLLALDGIAIVALPTPDSTRYEGDEHEPMDRLAWGTGSKFAVSHWQYPEVQIAYDDEPFEPIAIAEARAIAAALLAAADAAEQAAK